MNPREIDFEDFVMSLQSVKEVKEGQERTKYRKKLLVGAAAGYLFKFLVFHQIDSALDPI